MMAIPHAKSGEVIDIRPLGSAAASSGTVCLVKTPTLEIGRLVIPAGKHISQHRVPGEITIQCLEGRVCVTAGGVKHDMQSGQLLYLDGDVNHSLQGIEDASMLLTILL